MCCGRARSISSGPRLDSPPRNGVVFAYLGRTALSVKGPATGAVYRFVAPGARLQVDARDADALRKVAVLRAIG